MLLLQERRTAVCISSSLPGLSRRESEVLSWVALGKTNAGIATILGISRRTVEKLLERIYDKLGVETRTSAAMRMVEVLKMI